MTIVLALTQLFDVAELVQMLPLIPETVPPTLSFVAPVAARNTTDVGFISSLPPGTPAAV